MSKIRLSLRPRPNLSSPAQFGWFGQGSLQESLKRVDLETRLGESQSFVSSSVLLVGVGAALRSLNPPHPIHSTQLGIRGGGLQLNIPIYVQILHKMYSQRQTESSCTCRGRVILTPPCSSHGADLPNLSPCPPHRVSRLPGPPEHVHHHHCSVHQDYNLQGGGDRWGHHMRSLPQSSTIALVQASLRPGA